MSMSSLNNSERIHPYDMGEILSAIHEDPAGVLITKETEPIDVYNDGRYQYSYEADVIVFNGKRYTPTTTVPPKTEGGQKMLRELLVDHPEFSDQQSSTDQVVVCSMVRDDDDADRLTIAIALKDGRKREDCSVITVERVVAKWLADALSVRGWVEYRLERQSFKL